MVDLSIAVLASYAKPGTGIKLGNLTLSPYVDISAAWDSNVQSTDSNKEDSVFLDIVPGLAFVNKTDKLILRGSGWSRFRRYQNVTGPNSDSYGEGLGIVWGEGNRLTLGVNEDYAHFTDYEIEQRTADTSSLTDQNLMLTEDRTERVERDVIGVGPAMDYRFSDKLRGNVSYRYSSLKYNNSSLFGWNENRGQLELARKITDKTSALVNGQYGEQSSEGSTNNSTYYIARGGFQYEATKKAAFKGSAGVESYDSGNTNSSSSGQGLSRNVFSFDMTATWQATEKIHMEAMARNDIEPSVQYRENARNITQASMGASYDITQSWVLSLAGSWRYDDYLGKVKDQNDQVQDKNATLYGGRLRLNYKTSAGFCDVYTETTYEKAKTNIEDETGNYEQWRVAIGLNLHY